MDKYRYYIGSTEVFPLNDKELKAIYEKPIPSSVYLEKKLSASVSFNSKGSFNFKTQQASDPTVELDFIIKQLCNGTYSDFIKLKFTVAEGDFDDDNCIFTVSTKSVNDFRKDIKVNIIIKQNIVNAGLAGQGVYFENTLNAADNATYTNAYYFDKTILSVAQESNPKIVGLISDFFQINPINVSSDALPGVPNVWTKMAFCALSDVQQPVPSDKAQVEFITFQELMDDLNALFDVFWFIDANNYLRVEHRIFFEGILGLDLTAARYEKYLLGTNKYNYALDDYPRTETLKVTNSLQYAKFTNGYFATINKNNKEIVKESKKINTDFTNIFYLGGSSTSDGLFLFACTGTTAYQMVDDLNTGTTFANTVERVTGQNIYLTPHYLLYFLHTYGKFDTGSFFESLIVHSPGSSPAVPDYWARGQIRAGGFKHQTVRPIILQKKISVPLCCDDVFEPDKLIRTELGDGAVHKANLSLRSDMLELEIKYPAPAYGFAPTDLPGLDLWLRGDTGINLFSTNNWWVQSWDDSSGNGRHAVGSANHYPFNGSTTPYGVRFSKLAVAGPNAINNAYAFLTVPGFQLFPAKRGTIFIMYELEYDVASGGTTNRNSSLFSTNDAGVSTSFFDISLANVALYSANLSVTNVAWPQNLFTNRRLFQLKRIADDKVICRDNSRDVPTIQSNANFSGDLLNPKTIDNVLHTIKDIIIGENNQFSAATCNPIILEVLVFDTALSDVDCERVELFLAKKPYYKQGSYVKENF